ncbi:MAG: regulatory protein RecX [Planctomycetota bacterium]
MTPAADEVARAKAIAMRLLRVTDRSRAALLERLIDRDISPASAEVAVDALEHANLVNDSRLAEETIARELGRGPTGRARLEAKLRSMRVPDDIARRALEAAFADRDPVPDAEACARAKLRAMPPRLDPPARARRLAGALARRGFDPSTVATVVSRLVAEADSEAVD